MIARLAGRTETDTSSALLRTPPASAAGPPHLHFPLFLKKKKLCSKSVVPLLVFFAIQSVFFRTESFDWTMLGVGGGLLAEMNVLIGPGWEWCAFAVLRVLPQEPGLLRFPWQQKNYMAIKVHALRSFCVFVQICCVRCLKSALKG